MKDMTSTLTMTVENISETLGFNATLTWPITQQDLAQRHDIPSNAI
jgi:hypothetical protein